MVNVVVHGMPPSGRSTLVWAYYRASEIKIALLLEKHGGGICNTIAYRLGLAQRAVELRQLPIQGGHTRFPEDVGNLLLVVRRPQGSNSVFVDPFAEDTVRKYLFERCPELRNIDFTLRFRSKGFTGGCHYRPHSVIAQQYQQLLDGVSSIGEINSLHDA